MSTPLLQLQSISKKYGHEPHYALQEINLQVTAGCFVTVVGESGSGKSTLLRLAAGLENPDTGQVHFDGELVLPPQEKLIPGHEGMAMADQELRLFPNHTVAENLTHPLRHLPGAEQEEILHDLLRFCRLESAAAKKPAMLSGGERQRIAIARALATEAELLLLDEPFSHLDPHLQQQFGAELRQRMQAQGMAGLLVMHSPEVALAISDQIVVLQAGKIVQQGSPEQLYTRPLSPYVARLFGPTTVLTAEEALALGLPLRGEYSLGVRQEAVSVAPFGESPLSGTLQEARYMGFAYRLTIATEPGPVLEVLSPRQPVVPGAACSLTIDHQKLLYWP